MPIAIKEVSAGNAHLAIVLVSQIFLFSDVQLPANRVRTHRTTPSSSPEESSSVATSSSSGTTCTTRCASSFLCSSLAFRSYPLRYSSALASAPTSPSRNTSVPFLIPVSLPSRPSLHQQRPKRPLPRVERPRRCLTRDCSVRTSPLVRLRGSALTFVFLSLFLAYSRSRASRQRQKGRRGDRGRRWRLSRVLADC